MSSWDRIKQFFLNIGNKMKFWGQPKKISDGMPWNGSYTDERSEFCRNIQFTGDLLDPRVCNGKNIVPNILEALGANKDVITNPYVIEEIRRQIELLAEQSGIEKPNYDEQLTRKKIEAYLQAIKNARILTEKDRQNIYAGLGNMQHKDYVGISIEQETGAVNIQSTMMSGKDFKKRGNQIIELSYRPDEEGNVVEDHSYYRIDPDSKEAILIDKSKDVYNPNGIEIKSEIKTYKQENGQDVLMFHRKRTRDEQYPFVALEETIVNGMGHGSSVGKKYIAIKMTRLQFLIEEWQANGRIPISFKDRTQVDEYYEENKAVIHKSFTEEPIWEVYESSELRRRIKAGIKELAIKAGMLKEENVIEQ